MPHEDLPLDGAKHDQNQHDGGELGENAKDDTERASEFCSPQKDGKPLTHADTFAALIGLGHVGPTAG